MTPSLTPSEVAEVAHKAAKRLIPLAEALSRITANMSLERKNTGEGK